MMLRKVVGDQQRVEVDQLVHDQPTSALWSEGISETLVQPMGGRGTWEILDADVSNAVVPDNPLTRHRLASLTTAKARRSGIPPLPSVQSAQCARSA